MKVYRTDEIRNVVLLGHGGSGKTSLAEAMLYVSGATNRMGKISESNTVSDFDKEEQKRGFSISTSLVPIEWEKAKINILDTPGYFDFVGEVEEAVSAADAAVIVVSGKAGVQVGTEKAWELCDKYNLPRMIYVTEMDVDDASFRQVVADLTERYGKKIAPHFQPVPLRAVDRKSLTPIVAFGGPCACNPEPVAEFADIIFLGEGEETTNTVLDLLKKCKESGKSKQEFLEAAMHIQGIYVPSFYEDSYNPDGTLCALTPTHGAPATVKKSIVSDMNKCYYPDSFVVPFIDIVHDRAVEEIFRGCIRGCRFCQAGFIYRPIREKSVETINRQSKALIDSTGYDELSLCSLSTSDHSCVNEMLTSLIDWTVRDKINLSLPSLRVDNFSDELVDKLSKVRRSGLTFAPEAGTQRMRDVINKNVTEEEVLRTCTKAFAGGWTSVKLYFMMGLPTETMEDIAGIAQLAGKVVDAYYNTPEHKKGCAVSVSVSCASFIPKPFTPFQWEPEDTMTSLKAKQAHLLESVPSRKIRVSYHETPTSLLEGVLARGDRRLSKVLLRAFELGCKFDSWDDHFNFDAWMQAFEECGLDPDFYTKRRRPFEELLPWDHLDYGVSRKFLELENKRAHQNVTTPHCRIRCAGCGANKLNGGHCDARPEVARDTTAVQ